MTEKKRALSDLHREYWHGLDKSVTLLEHSLNKCNSIGIKVDFTEPELEAFESLTSRFARTSDIYLQKLLRSTFELLEESPFSMLDLLNSAEKKQLIHSAEKMSEIRSLRNSIAHDYWIEEIQHGFAQALELTPHLLEAIEMTKHFSQERGWL